MKTRAKIKKAAITAAIIGAVFWPVPLAGFAAAFLAAGISSTHPISTRLPVIAQGAQNWLATSGYLPWNAWAVVLAHEPLLIAWAVATVLVFLWLAALALTTSRAAAGSGYGGPEMAGKGEHGTSRWRTQGELVRSFRLWQPKSGVTGILLGAGPQHGTAYVDDTEEHGLLLGATGSGKTRGIILPTIAVIGSAKTASLLLTDPKGELYAHTAGWLRAQGYEVVRFDLREPSRSARWNPVQALANALAEGRRDTASTLAWDAAHLLAGSLEGKSADPYWGLAAEGLIAALMLTVAAGEPQPPAVLAGEAPWRWPEDDERHMASVYATLLAGGAGGGRLDDLFAQYPPDHPARMAYGGTALTVDRTRASILGTAAAALRLFADEEVAWLVGAQDHELAAAGERLTATFLVVPDERSTRYPLATLYIQQTLQALAALADEHGGRLPVPVTVLLDEFGNLPEIKNFDKTVTVARSRGIRLLLAVQDLAQVKRHYGDAAHTITGNLGLWVYLSTSDLDTAKTVSEKLGRYTVAAENLSVPRVTFWTTAATVGTATKSQTLLGRDLLTAEEVLRWPRGQALVLQARHLPAKLPLPDLSAWRRVWPEIQERRPEPPTSPISAPPTWRPPDEGADEPDDRRALRFEPPPSPPKDLPGKDENAQPRPNYDI